MRSGREPPAAVIRCGVLPTGKRQPRSAANLSGSQPQEVDDRMYSRTIRYKSSRRTSGSLSCEPLCPRVTATCHCEWITYTLSASQMNGGEMRIIIWTILALVLSSTGSVAQTTLNAGHYVLRNTPHDLFVNLGTEVILNVRFKPLKSCPIRSTRCSDTTCHRTIIIRPSTTRARLATLLLIVAERCSVR